MATQQRLNAIVHGRVQGVNFRYYTQQQAQRLGLVGWVKNRADTTVEVVAEGSPAQLAALLDWLHEGSPHARVDEVEVFWQEATGEFSAFTVRY
ncbi:MAG: acylphosphatase [Anaerolineae bacterium]|nr:acylphosphatase [Anaerolineae bacterium]